MTEGKMIAEADKLITVHHRTKTLNFSRGQLVMMMIKFHEQLLQQTPCKTHVCHHCGGVDGHTIECTAWCGKTVTV